MLNITTITNIIEDAGFKIDTSKSHWAITTRSSKYGILTKFALTRTIRGKCHITIMENGIVSDGYISKETFEIIRSNVEFINDKIDNEVANAEKVIKEFDELVTEIKTMLKRKESAFNVKRYIECSSERKFNSAKFANTVSKYSTYINKDLVEKYRSACEFYDAVELMSRYL